MRRALNDRERYRRSHLLCQHIARSGLLLRYRRFTAFYTSDGEVDLSPLFARLWQQGKQIYLPVIPGPRLCFVEYLPTTALALNAFGIPEPRAGRERSVPLISLDVILMPLVAFDPSGNRIGMGGGYYDKTFAFKRIRPGARKPVLIGVAFDFQRYPSLPPCQPWDVPLNGAVTDAGFEWFGPRHRATSEHRLPAHDKELDPS